MMSGTTLLAIAIPANVAAAGLNYMLGNPTMALINATGAAVCLARLLYCAVRQRGERRS